MLTLTQSALNSIVAGFMQHVVAGNYTGPFYGTYIGLMVAGPNPTKEVQRADYTEASYTGYARQAIGTAGASFNGTDGLTKIVFPDLQFQPTDAVTPNTITHVGIYSALTNGTLLGVHKLETPVPLPNAEAALIYGPEIGIPYAGGYGNGDVET